MPPCQTHTLLRAARQRGRCGIILQKDALGVSNKIIQKGLDFDCDRSVSVAMLMRAAAETLKRTETALAGPPELSRAVAPSVAWAPAFID